jgi:hypothetical protein
MGREGRTKLDAQAKPLKWLYLGKRSERTHIRIKFLLRMTNTMTSQNIVLSSWDILYVEYTCYRTAHLNM